MFGIFLCLNFELISFSFNILQSTDEEIEQSYEEFYEDVHTEFLKFGELANFKVLCASETIWFPFHLMLS